MGLSCRERRGGNVLFVFLPLVPSQKNKGKIMLVFFSSWDFCMFCLFYSILMFCHDDFYDRFCMLICCILCWQSYLILRLLLLLLVRKKCARVQCLRDTSLPVQIEAAASLRYLIELDEAEEPVLRVLPDILNEYFRIMQEIGLDEVKASNRLCSNAPVFCGKLCKCIIPLFFFLLSLSWFRNKRGETLACTRFTLTLPPVTTD